MMYKNHLIFGCVASGATPLIMSQVWFNLMPIDYAVVIPTVIAGSLFSDCDTASIPSRIYAVLGAIMSVFFYMMGDNSMIAVLWVPFILAKMFKHRGWTHSAFFPILLTALPFVLFRITLNSQNYQYIARSMYEYRLVFVSFSIGLVVHGILDTLWFKKFAVKIGIHKD